MTAATAVDVVGVSKRFGAGPDAVVALDRVSLALRANEFFTLLGPSGCGKTTLLRMIAGFEEPDDGELKLYGQSLRGLPPFRRPVNTVFQSYALFPHLTVGQNVAFGLEMQKRARAEIGPEVAQALALVRLGGYEGRYPRQLSGGQQQRVALARALANRPRVLLLDEPLSALDLKLRKEMQLELKRLQTQTGITFVFVTHDQEEALTMSDRIAVMDKGRVLQVGTPEDIYERPGVRFVAGFIGDTNLLEGSCVASDGTGARCVVDGVGELVSAMPATAGGRVTLAIRPERAELAPADAPGLPATVEQVVYFGTDTTFHLRLGGGQPFQARVQNRRGAVHAFQAGDAASLSVPPEAVRLLAD
ncbi:MAG: ABC transporter ATP-binding protein [Geminicoccaceae bacterium]